MAEGRFSTFDPAVLDRLAGLSLVARTVVEGFMSGHHRSPHAGSSVEFSQYREYVPGDELKRIDWKVFARSDRLVVKEFVEETNLALHLLVDSSESMAYGSLDWSKFDYARWCAAALGYLTLMQRDTVGLVLFDDEHKQRVSPGNGAPQQKAITDLLEGATADGPTGIGKVLNWLGTRLSRRGIIAIFSDFFDDPDQIVSGLRRLKFAGHEPILFQILDPQEVRFEFGNQVKLEGLEASGSLRVDAKAIRAQYLAEVERHNDALAREASSLNIDIVRIDTTQPLDAVLSTYLAHRSARARGGRR